jgi:glucokinase
MTVLACDIGATRIKFGIVREGRVLTQDFIPSYSDRGLQPRLPELVAGMKRLCAESHIALQECAGLSVSVPSLVDPVAGRALAAYGCFYDMPNINLRDWARSQLGLPFAIENDARMAAIGEWRHGACRGCDNIVMITLGTGLGTSAVIQGRVLRGKHGQAGCLGGHLSVRYNGQLCHCGNMGCAEAEASTKFLAEIAQKRTDFPTSRLRREPVLDYAAVFRHAADGDPCASAIRDHSLLVWATMAVNLIHAYDPELFVIGGGIMASADVIVPSLQDFIDRHAHTPWGKVRVVASELGDAAALVAAEWLIEEQSRRTKIS